MSENTLNISDKKSHMDIRNLLNEAEHTPKRFICTWDDCDKKFTRKSDLSRHTRIHTGERPYHCDWPACGKQFIQQSALTVHYRTHTGDRPHVCGHSLCRKAFSDSSSLARHRRTHTGKRPYSCLHPDCGKSFTRKTTLSRHQRCHDPKWTTYNWQKTSNSFKNNGSEISDELLNIVSTDDKASSCNDPTASSLTGRHRSENDTLLSSSPEHLTSKKPQEKPIGIYTKNSPLNSMIELPQKTKNMHTYRILNYGSFNKTATNASSIRYRA